jgi:uncharacterized protein GlcG (DUF336 family)
MITLKQAKAIIEAAEAKAVLIGQPMNIAVAHEGGNLIAHARMDGAWIGSIDISIKKAYTSRAFDIATKDLAALVADRGSKTIKSRKREQPLWRRRGMRAQDKRLACRIHFQSAGGHPQSRRNTYRSPGEAKACR